MSYKKNNSNRDALFGAAGPKHKRDAASNRDALFGSADGGKKKTSSTNPAPTTSRVASNTNKGYKSKPVSRGKKPSLSPELKAAKLKEAEDYKQKANKCMERGFFSKPDPVAASTYFKRAADCYQQAGDLRLERYYRVASGDCNLQMGAWASAASDYTRAAELFLQVDDDDNLELEQRRRDASEYHKKAATAWTEMNEKAKAAQSQVQAAIALNYGEEGTLLSKDAVAGLEEAVEAHVPDVFNPYARYRQTGHSAYIDPDSDETAEHPSAETLEMAESQIVTRSYSHEPLQELVYLFCKHGEYAPALYAAGAATTILERENLSALSLGRAFCTETILLLAMGDPVAAEERFLNAHVQHTSYLTTRECKLSEDLFRAVKMRDGEALEEARSPTGSNRAALANLHESLRVLVSELRLSGVARKNLGTTTTTASNVESKKAPSKPETSLNDLLQQKTGYEKEVAQGQELNADVLQDEMDALDFGDDDDDDGDVGFGGDGELDELEDDDIDLR